MIKVTSSSPCKCIISGEHSVVYNKPAITATLNSFIKINGEYNFLDNKSQITLILRQIGREKITIVMKTKEFKSFMFPFIEHNLELSQLGDLLGPAFEDKDVMAFCMAFSLTFRSIYQAIEVDLKQFIEIISRFDCRLLVESEVPVGAGLGSSASFGTSLIMNYYV